MNAGKTVMHLMVATVMAVSVFAVGKSEAASGDGTAAVDPQNSGVHHGLRVSFETRAVECSGCHETKYAEWRFAAGSDMKTVGQGTYHALSSTEPMYKGLLAMFNGSPMQDYCKGCHEAGSALAVVDKVNTIPVPRTTNVEEGVNCLTCHFDGKRMVASSDMRDSVLCATCHNDNSGLMDCYTEWLNDYKGGKSCQQCHMENGSHLFLGYNSPSFVKKAVAISEPVISGIVSAGNPFDISFTLNNNGTGHSVPEDLLRLLRARVSIKDASGQEIYSQETLYYKRSSLFAENTAETVVIKAGETKQVNVPGVIIPSPGTYTVSIELLQDSNRAMSSASTTAFMGSTYRTIVVQ